MNRLVALSAPLFSLVLIVASASADPERMGNGRTKTLTLAQLKGFRVWEQGPSGFARSAIPGNIRRSFTVRFKNDYACESNTLHTDRFFRDAVARSKP